MIVDDLARLSRDLFDMGRIVFQDLLADGVRVIDVMTGIASDHASARQIFAAIGIGNDAFLQMVKTETHRGLDGRARAGFWTGGRAFGWRIEKETNPPDPEHVRSVLVIDDREAVIVRWIFKVYAEGLSYAAIADQLNRDGVAAPYDNLVVKKQGRGWGKGTVRAILLNERYIGRFIWNKRKYVRNPKKKNRKAVERPRSEWRILERPELAIISPEIWDAVQKCEFRGMAITYSDPTRSPIPIHADHRFRSMPIAERPSSEAVVL